MEIRTNKDSINDLNWLVEGTIKPFMKKWEEILLKYHFNQPLGVSEKINVDELERDCLALELEFIKKYHEWETTAMHVPYRMEVKPIKWEEHLKNKKGDKHD